MTGIGWTRGATVSAAAIAAFLLSMGSQPVVGQEAGTQGRGDLRVALTFDDLPAQSTRRDTETYAAINRDILAALAEADAPAVGFVNENKLYVDGSLSAERVAILDAWLAAGQELGNHTWSHPDLHRVPVAEYLLDLERGGEVTRPLVEARGSTFRYFRHPYLHTGQSPGAKADVDAALERLGYRIAPVTVDNGEWIYARAYDVALDDGDLELADRIVVDYVDYMDSVFGYYEQQSTALLGYRLPQVLLLHGNRLNGASLPALLSMLRRRGYAWVTLEEALADPAYDRPDAFMGAAGITWLHRWALADGHRGAFFAGEPAVTDWVQTASGLGNQEQQDQE